MSTKTIKERGERERRSYQARIETFRSSFMVLTPKVVVLTLLIHPKRLETVIIKDLHLHFIAFVTNAKKKCGYIKYMDY